MQAVFLKAAGEYEQFANPYFGLYIFRTADVPTSDWDMSRTLWSSDDAFIYKKSSVCHLRLLTSYESRENATAARQ